MEKNEKSKDRERSKGVIQKTWKRCLSLGNIGRSNSSPDFNRSTNGKSWSKGPQTPQGCFSVCVGAEKEKFAIRTECLNHPSFRILLDESEVEYGFTNEGPIVLPCDIEHFERVLWGMENDYFDPSEVAKLGCDWCLGINDGYQMLSPARPAVVHRFRRANSAIFS